LGLILALALGRGLVKGYLDTRVELHIYDGDRRIAWYTHQKTVAAVLREARVEPGPEDVVSPGLAAHVRDGDAIRVLRARQATVVADGRVMHLQTHAESVGNLLREVDLRLAPRDWLTLNGDNATLETPLNGPGESLRSVTDRGLGRLASLAVINTPIELVIHRAVPIRLNDDGESRLFYTTHQTIGQALLAEGIALHLGDEISPLLDAPVLSNTEIVIRRSRPVVIDVDGKRIRTRTQTSTVGEILAQEGVTLVGLDYTVPPEDAPLPESQPIHVFRVQRAFVIEQEPIPYDTIWLPDPGLDLDHQQLEQEGHEGVHRWRYDVIYENDQEVARNLEDEWLAHEPMNKAIAYGTKITVRELETPEGTFEYWRRIRMLATSYTAATSGKQRDHPQYGITRLGWQMRHGIVAVDPTVIKLGGQVYVPGYGKGDVADTGGAIKGRRIDLGYEENGLVYWLKWVDVYVLTPVPPPNQIRYVLPDWPRQP
jgi:uncharacterized protein YabE (DUF348 family)